MDPAKTAEAANFEAAFEARLRTHFVELFHTDKLLWLGFSGGLDSTVLLHLLKRLGVRFKAVHINHQISSNASDWRDHCEIECARLGVEFVSHAVTVESKGRGLEDAARTSRYQIFERLTAQGGHLLTGHHQDDQAETLLLRQLRGAGVVGMAAMAERRALGGGQLLRPLLGFSRRQLAQYAVVNGLSWIEDESNVDAGFDRNYIRHQVAPQLAARWPQFAQKLALSAEHCREAADLLTEVAEADLTLLAPRSARTGESICLVELAKLSLARGNNVLRHWFGLHGLALTNEQLVQLRNQWLCAAVDAQPSLTIGKLELARFQNRGYLLPQLPLATDLVPQILKPGQVLTIGAMRFALQAADDGLRLPKQGYWWVRPRQLGERCHPVYRDRSQTLKKCLQEQGLEPWLRSIVPLVCAPDSTNDIWAVGDLWLDRRAPCAESTAYRPCWWFENTDF